MGGISWLDESAWAWGLGYEDSRRRAVARRSQVGPESRMRRQGWMLDFEGACWVSEREACRMCPGMGVERKARVVYFGYWNLRRFCCRYLLTYCRFGILILIDFGN